MSGEARSSWQDGFGLAYEEMFAPRRSCHIRRVTERACGFPAHPVELRTGPRYGRRRRRRCRRRPDGDEPDESVELWGLVSDLDLAAAACGDLDARTAGTSAVTPLVTVSDVQPLAEAAELMALRGTAHLAVLDSLTRRPIGVVSTLDVARAVAAGQGISEVQPSC